MDGWELLIEAGLFLGTLVLIATLQWTSVERALSHREWARRRQDSRAPAVDWYVTLGVAAGCM
jgi:hypothetical protein